MTTGKERCERRKHRRFQTNDLVIAVSSCDKLLEFGKVKDISKGGLRIEYVGDQKPTVTECDINILTNQLYISSLPCRIIWSRETENDSPFSYNKNWQCGVAFVELMKEQQELLDELVNNFSSR